MVPDFFANSHQWDYACAIYKCQVIYRISEMHKLKVTLLLICFSSGLAFAEEHVKAEIIKRCKAQMGSYGSSMVKACVDQDIEALVALNKYSEMHKSIVGRCYLQMKDYGYVMIKACADQDIEAEEALSQY